VWSSLFGGVDTGTSSSSRGTSLTLQPLDAAQKKMFEAMLPVTVSTTSLDFGPLVDEHVRRSLIITNPNRRELPPVAWKALTNCQHHYGVRPNMGILNSGDSVTVMLIRDTAKAHANIPPTSRRKPAFLIRSTPIPQKWYPKDGRDDLIALWKQLTNMQDNLILSEIKILANKPEPLSSSAIATSGGTIGKPSSDEDLAAELARLHAENAFLRAQVSSLSPPSPASGSGSGSGNQTHVGPSSSAAASRPIGNGRPLSDYQWEDAAPSYEEAVSQETPSPRLN
jgi:hypothetical protein